MLYVWLYLGVGLLTSLGIIVYACYSASTKQELIESLEMQYVLLPIVLWPVGFPLLLYVGIETLIHMLIDWISEKRSL